MTFERDPLMISGNELPACNAPEHTPKTASIHSISRQGIARMFHPLPKEIQNVVEGQYKESNARLKACGYLLHPAAAPIHLSGLETIITTPLPSDSNIGTGTQLNDIAVFFSMNSENGILYPTVNGLTEFICDYANRWHSALPSEDPENITPNRHLPGTSPMFAYLPADFDKAMLKGPKHAAAELAKRFSREEFWQLRYLFAIVKTGSEHPGQFGHVSVCVISPESKSIDYLCSIDDDGLMRSQGSQCVESFICLLAEFLGEQAPLAQRFNPCDWKLRTNRSEIQDEYRPDCGMHTISNIMCLAFGWDLSYGPRSKREMELCRVRLVANLLFGGFRGYNPAENADNSFYYPLNDVRPDSSPAANFLPILKFPGLQIQEALSFEVRCRSPVYYGCPDKETLYKHCDRNRRFYPDFDAEKISGPKVSFAKFLSWVEHYDLARARDMAPFPKPYESDGSNGNSKWLPPNATSQYGKLW